MNMIYESHRPVDLSRSHVLTNRFLPVLSTRYWLRTPIKVSGQPEGLRTGLTEAHTHIHQDHIPDYSVYIRISPEHISW